MDSTAASASPSIWKRGDQEVSLVRMYVIRVGCLASAIALGSSNLPDLIWPDPMARGMITAILGGLLVMVTIGIRYPLKMVPIFLFEFVWKTIWLLRFGLPQWMAGTGSPRLSQDLIDIGLFPIVVGLIIPWGYVWRHYVKAPAERWR
ncbi:MAG TPA: hypothetical protein VGO55_13245 [Allosphingosinicella sp.]|jgi:hypothetical protein|nr:hypothetical protein [Allosphingosinicella sp.]